MADDLQFELVTPERLLLAERAEMVGVPGREGQMGIYRRHVPMIATLGPGAVKIWREGREARRLFVDGGFLEVTGERCTVLAEEATPVEDFDRAHLEQKVRDCREDLEDAGDPLERARARHELTLAKARLQVLTGELVA